MPRQLFCRCFIHRCFSLTAARTEKSPRRFSIATTYSPVENIPIVNTMQAHDRICSHSIEVKKRCGEETGR